jgi:hypothetical protein
MMSAVSRALVRGCRRPTLERGSADGSDQKGGLIVEARRLIAAAAVGAASLVATTGVAQASPRVSCDVHVDGRVVVQTPGAQIELPRPPRGLDCTFPPQ